MVDVQPIQPNTTPNQPNPTPNQPTNPQGGLFAPSGGYPEKPTPPIIVDNPSKPDYTFTNDDVQHLIDDIHNKHKKIKPDKVINDILGLDIVDKYDGIKMKDKTMPWSKVAKGAALGVAGGVATGMAGPSLMNNAISTAGGMIGYYVAGETGAVIGSLAGSGIADKYNKPYAGKTNINPHNLEYEEIPNSSRVGSSGTVISTARQRLGEQRTTSLSKETLFSRLGDAVKDASYTRTPVKTKIKESKLLKDLERKQATYGTINKSDVQSIETQPSTFEHMREKAKDLYRRISGQKKGEYTQLTTTDDTHDDFSKTLKESKQAGQTKGTYAITEPEIDIEKELEKMSQKSSPQRWAAMKQYKQQNEQNIRKSIARTDAEERKRDRVDQQVSELLDFRHELPAYSGLRPSVVQTRVPPPPMSPVKQFMATSNLNKLSQKLLSKENTIKEKNIGRDTLALNLKRIEAKKAKEAKKVKAMTTIEQALKNRKARQEFKENKELFNPIDYQDKLRVNKKTFVNQVADYTTRRKPPLNKIQSEKLKYATKRVNSISKLTEKRKQTGRPPDRDPEARPTTSRLSTASARLSTASTLPPDSPGAAFTPKKR